MLYSLLTSVLVGDGWLTPRPGRFFPGKEAQFVLYRRLCGPQFRSGRHGEKKTTTADRSLNPRIILPVANRYPDTHNLKSYSKYVT